MSSNNHHSDEPIELRRPGFHPSPAPLVPAYYWAGAGSRRIHWMKGFRRPVDGPAYDAAYDEERLRWLRDRAGVNFLFLTYNWGLPPEIECEDWDAFSETAARAHHLGMGAAAYIQASNAAVQGSYERADWYAERPDGSRIPFYSGRDFTCLHSAEWRESVRRRVRDAVQRGADAIFVDNCTFGAMPVPLARDYTGFAGCACHRCQASFRRWQMTRREPAAPIPRRFRPGRDPVSASFSDWRARTVTDFLGDIRRTIEQIKPGVPLLTNTVGAVNVNTYHLFGVDLPAIAEVVDWLFVENLQAPRAEPKRLVHNAGTYKLLHALKPGAPALSITYDRGIGVDAVPPPSLFARTMAEGYASGGIPVVRATEYIEDGTWTLLQPRLHEQHAAATRQVVDFVRSRTDEHEERRPAAAVGIFAPVTDRSLNDVYPEHGADFLAVIQALVGAAIPFRVVPNLEDAAHLEGLNLLLLPAGASPPGGFTGRVLYFAELGIAERRRSLFDLFARPLEPLIAWAGPKAVDGYFTRSFVRRFVDRLDIFVRLVFLDRYARRAIEPDRLIALRDAAPCFVEAGGPVFADLWETDSGLQLHLVNYADEPVSVRVRSKIGAPSRLVALGEPAPFTPPDPGETFTLNCYAILEWSRPPVEEIPQAAPSREKEALP